MIVTPAPDHHAAPGPVLGVGNLTVDIVTEVDAFPGEDAEVRARRMRRSRGGNAANTLVVLARLGRRCRFAGTVGGGPEADAALADLAHHGVDTGACRRVPGALMPTSCVLLSRATGSRTIVHYRDLPEYRAADLARQDLSACAWLHLEGRDPGELRGMLEHAADTAPGLPRSLEVEKPRRGIEALFAQVDVLLFSRHYAAARGHESAEALLRAVRPQAPRALLVCAWGAAGGWALDDGRLLHSPAVPPPALVDTLGAGDAFNAGVIDGLLGGRGVAGALAHACAVAGRKCGMEGFSGLGPV